MKYELLAEMYAAGVREVTITREALHSLMKQSGTFTEINIDESDTLQIPKPGQRALIHNIRIFTQDPQQ